MRCKYKQRGWTRWCVKFSWHIWIYSLLQAFKKQSTPIKRKDTHKGREGGEGGPASHWAPEQVTEHSDHPTAIFKVGMGIPRAHLQGAMLWIQQKINVYGVKQKAALTNGFASPVLMLWRVSQTFIPRPEALTAILKGPLPVAVPSGSVLEGACWD